MIVNHLSRLAGERRWSIKRLANEAGLSYSTVHDKLCQTLGVGVGDILEYQP
jgi:DNA-binding Xre family transcriptional regulator